MTIDHGMQVMPKHIVLLDKRHSGILLMRNVFEREKRIVHKSPVRFAEIGEISLTGNYIYRVMKETILGLMESGVYS